jgi:hypothetical protein
LISLWSLGDCGQTAAPRDVFDFVSAEVVAISIMVLTISVRQTRSLPLIRAHGVLQECVYQTRISDFGCGAFNGLTTRGAFIHASCDARNATTEGDTQWVKKKTRRFSLRSAAS